MANKKRPTLISDCPDSMIGQVSLLNLGGQTVQFIQVHTEGPYKCALCPANGVDFWTINKPFATSDGGPLLPPYALVCPQHGPAIQQTASDYAAAVVEPEPELVSGLVVNPDTDMLLVPDGTHWQCGDCGLILNETQLSCSCGSDRTDACIEIEGPCELPFFPVVECEPSEDGSGLATLSCGHTHGYAATQKTIKVGEMCLCIHCRPASSGKE